MLGISFYTKVVETSFSRYLSPNFEVKANQRIIYQADDFWDTDENLKTTMETATIIIRVIRSFEFRNIRNIVLKDVPLDITYEELLLLISQKLPTAPGLPPPFRKYDYDTLKVNNSSIANGTNNLLI